MFGRNLTGPIQVLVFKSEAEFRQSNVGVMTSQDQETNIGGTAKLVGSKMFLYGRGDRLAMERDVREGLARILFNQAMYESQWTEALRNGNLVQVPEWMSEAPPDTPAVAWTRGVQRASWMPPKLVNSNAWIKLQAPMRRFLGQAVWAYVADIYGLPTIANVLYMTRITRSPENGFRLATGSFLQNWPWRFEITTCVVPPLGMIFTCPHSNRKRPCDKRAQNGRCRHSVETQRRYQYTQFVLSPDQTQWAFTTNERGQLRVGTVDVATGKLTWHAVLGHRLARLEDDAPLVWHGIHRAKRLPSPPS